MSHDDYPIKELTPTLFPYQLSEIPDPPSVLYLRGTLPCASTPLIAIVGSRNYSNYGKEVVSYIIEGLRGFKVSIVSGLARGIDGLAHEAALRAGIHTIAVPGSGLLNTSLYPASNRPLAERILKAGGALLSEYEPEFKGAVWSFPKRNRIMAGLAKGVLLVEASERSGTLITARLALDYNRDVFAIPGNIFNDNAKGTHQFLKLGATMVTCPDDIIESLSLEKKSNDPLETDTMSESLSTRSEDETRLLCALSSPSTKDALMATLNLTSQECGVLLMRLELKGHISESGGLYYKRAGE